MYQPSSLCLGLLKSIENLALKPYLDKGGIPTIGYGCTYYKNGIKVKLSDAEITEERANELFVTILQPFIKCINDTITQPMKQQQFDAFLIMCYNCGIGAFSKPCEVAKNFNNGNLNTLPIWWIKSFITANGDRKPCEGLINRRKCELNIFMNGIYKKW